MSAMFITVALGITLGPWVVLSDYLSGGRKEDRRKGGRERGRGRKWEGGREGERMEGRMKTEGEREGSVPNSCTQRLVYLKFFPKF